MPANPAHGRWNCGVIKSGKTVCLLECNDKFSIKGSPIIECDQKQGSFDPDPGESLCKETTSSMLPCKACPIRKSVIVYKHRTTYIQSHINTNLVKL